MKAFGFVNTANGVPFGPGHESAPCTGYATLPLGVGTWRAMLASGTPAQLTAINALPGVCGICTVTEAGGVRWAELDGVITSASRTRLNNWITARNAEYGLSWPLVPAGWTYKAVILWAWKRLRNVYDLDSIDVADAE